MAEIKLEELAHVKSKNHVETVAFASPMKAKSKPGAPFLAGFVRSGDFQLSELNEEGDRHPPI
jgi:hypothetical protein